MNRTLYRLLIKTVPKPELRLGAWTGFSVSAGLTERLLDILRRERVQGGVLALMNAAGETTASAFGISRLRGRLPAQPGDFFRCASISKYVTAAGVLRLAASGRIDLDRDISEYLGYAVRHPKAPERALTLRLLISHRAGLRDGESYQAALTDPVPLSRLLNQPDSYMPWAPDGGFEYSNLGAGVAGGASFIRYFRPIYVIYGAIITILPMIIGFFFSRFVMKMPLLNTLGSLTGGMTSTPALGTLISTAGTEAVASAYAATYPIALLSIVIATKLMIQLL